MKRMKLISKGKVIATNFEFQFRKELQEDKRVAAEESREEDQDQEGQGQDRGVKETVRIIREAGAYNLTESFVNSLGGRNSEELDRNQQMKKEEEAELCKVSGDMREEDKVCGGEASTEALISLDIISSVAEVISGTGTHGLSQGRVAKPNTGAG